MRTYDPKKRYGGTGRAFGGGGRGADGEGGGKYRKNDVIDLLCGAGMEKQEWLKETETYLKSLQNEDGSFSFWQSSNQSNVMTTCYAALSLKAIGCEDKEVFEKAREYVLSLRNEDGSFGWANFNSKGSTDRLFGAIMTLKAVGHDEKRVFQECREYIESIENLDGGFGSMKGGISDIENTNMALLTLKAAGTQKKDMPASKKYVMSLKNGRDGGFDYNEVTHGSNVIRTSYAMLALHAVDCEVPEDSKEYIRRLERQDGFGWNEDYDPNNVFQLYHAVLGLFASGERDLPIEYEDYAKKLKNADGSFGWSASDRKSNVKNAFHAIMTIKAVHASRRAHGK